LGLSIAHLVHLKDKKGSVGDALSFKPTIAIVIVITVLVLMTVGGLGCFHGTHRQLASAKRRTPVFPGC
jgi:hypothetical protein